MRPDSALSRASAADPLPAPDGYEAPAVAAVTPVNDPLIGTPTQAPIGSLRL